MPTGVALSAAAGAALSKAGITGLTALQGALLYGGLAASQYLLTPQARKREVTNTRTFATMAPGIAARYVLGRRRVSGWMTRKKDGEAHDVPVGSHGAIAPSRFRHFVLVLSKGPCEAVEGVWINGRRVQIERAVRAAPNLAKGARPWAPYADQANAPADALILPHDDDPVFGRNHTVGADKNVPRFAIWPQLAGDGLHGADAPQGRRIESIAVPQGDNAWSTAHKALNKTYLYITLFQPGGEPDEILWRAMPEVEVLLKGMKVRVPVDAAGTLGPPTWTENAADVLWWLATERLGFRRTPHAASLLAARGVCGEVIDTSTVTRRRYGPVYFVARESTQQGQDAVHTQALYAWAVGEAGAPVATREGPTVAMDASVVLGIAEAGDATFAVAASAGTTGFVHAPRLYRWVSTHVVPVAGAAFDAGQIQTGPGRCLLLPTSDGARLLFFAYAGGSAQPTARFTVTVADGTAVAGTGGALPFNVDAAHVLAPCLVDAQWTLLEGDGADFSLYTLAWTDAGVITLGPRVRFTLAAGEDAATWRGRTLVGAVQAAHGVDVLYEAGVLRLSDAERTAGGAVIDADAFAAAAGDTFPASVSSLLSFPVRRRLADEGYPKQTTRYPCHALIRSDDNGSLLLQEVLWCMAGALYHLDGRAYMRAGAQRAAALHITDDDVVDVLEVQTSPPLRQRTNAISVAVAQSEEHDWLEAAAPEIERADWYGFDGAKFPLHLGPKAFVPHIEQASRIAAIELRRTRGALPDDDAVAAEISPALPAAVLCKLRLRPGPGFRWYALSPTDRVMVTLGEMGWAARVFEVVDTTANPDLSLTVSLIESPSGVYGDAAVSEVVPTLPTLPDPDRTAPPPPPTTPPPDATGVAAVAAVVVSGGAVRSSVTVSWTDAGYPVHVQLAGPDGTAPQTRDVQGATSTVFEVGAEGDYTASVWNVAGVRSATAATATANVSWEGQTTERTPNETVGVLASVDWNERLQERYLRADYRGKVVWCGDAPGLLLSVLTSSVVDAQTSAIAIDTDRRATTHLEFDFTGPGGWKATYRMDTLLGWSEHAWAAIGAGPVANTHIYGSRRDDTTGLAMFLRDWSASAIVPAPAVRLVEVRAVRDYSRLSRVEGDPVTLAVSTATAARAYSVIEWLTASQFIFTDGSPARSASQTLAIGFPGEVVGQTKLVANRMADGKLRCMSNARYNTLANDLTRAQYQGADSVEIPAGEARLVALAPDPDDPADGLFVAVEAVGADEAEEVPRATEVATGVVELATALELDGAGDDGADVVATAKRVRDFVAAYVQGREGINITTYHSLAELPAVQTLSPPSSLSPGTRARVLENAAPFAVTEFVVTNRVASQREWLCIAGTSGDLVNQNVDAVAEYQWVAVGSAVWDFRFPYFLVNFGAWSTTDAGWTSDEWVKVSAETVRALAPGVAGQGSAQTASGGNVVLIIPRDVGSNNNQRRVKIFRLGRTNTNGILLASGGVGSATNLSDAVPLRIRGTA